VFSARRDQHGKLYAIRADGGGLKRLTNYTAPKTVIAGSFSPDGNFITL
jgi:Tol biopolymer transport system component